MTISPTINKGKYESQKKIQKGNSKLFERVNSSFRTIFENILASNHMEMFYVNLQKKKPALTVVVVGVEYSYVWSLESTHPRGF